MKEYVARVGGRYTYKEDWENLQKLSLAISHIFDGCEPFIISGCEITGAVGSKEIAPGYIWMADKIRYFEGKTGVDLSTPNYLVESLATESVKYTGGGTKDGVNNYSVIWSDTTPGVGVAKIIIPATGVLPNMNDTFFGKYAILSNTSFSKQTIAQPLEVNNTLDVSKTLTVGGGTELSNVDLKRITSSGDTSIFRHTMSSEGVGYLQHFINEAKLGEVIFDPVNRVLIISINENNQVIITDGGIQLKSTTIDGSLTNGELKIDGDSINKVSEDIDGAELKLNEVGYNGGSTRYRDVSVYDGKGNRVTNFSGENREIAHYGVIIQNNSEDVGLKLKDSIKTKTDLTFKKAFAIYDKNNEEMLKLGYFGDDNNDVVVDNEAIGDIEIKPKQYLKVSKAIIEEGEVLSEKYAPKQDTLDALDGKVDVEAGKGLSSNDFTDDLKSKIQGVAGAVSIADGESGYVTGDQVFQHTSGFLDSSNNLSEVDAVAARGNLDVYKKSEADGKFLAKTNNLSDVDADIARTNLNAAEIGDSYLKNEVYPKNEVFTKEEVANIYQPIIEDTGYVACLNPQSTSSFNIRARKIGNIVNIIGSAAPKGEGGIWFALPNEIPAPPYPTGQILDADINDDHKYNRGMSIYCAANSKNFIVRQADGAKSEVFINITFMV